MSERRRDEWLFQVSANAAGGLIVLAAGYVFAVVGGLISGNNVALAVATLALLSSMYVVARMTVVLREQQERVEASAEPEPGVERKGRRKPGALTSPPVAGQMSGAQVGRVVGAALDPAHYVVPPSRTGPAARPTDPMVAPEYQLDAASPRSPEWGSATVGAVRGAVFGGALGQVRQPR